MTPAQFLISEEMHERQPHERAAFLRDCLCHAAGLLADLKGEEHAAETLYRIADALVAMTPTESDR